jgi:hypothetical protein
MNQSELLGKLAAKGNACKERLNVLKERCGSEPFDVSRSTEFLYGSNFYSEQITRINELILLVANGADIWDCMRLVRDLILTTSKKRILTCPYERAESETRMAALLNLNNILWDWHKSSVNAMLLKSFWS